MFKLLATILSRSGGQRLLVLIFHRVLDRPDPLRTKTGDAAEFNWQMELLRRYFNVLPLGEAIGLMSQDSLPARAACITFDDGYADNVSVALPLLQRHGLPATFFIATGFLDGGMMWNDTVIEAFRVAEGDRLDLVDLGFEEYSISTMEERRTAAFAVLAELKYRSTADRLSLTEAIVERVGQVLPKDLMMRSEDVQTLARAGMEIGAHTVHHPILESLTTDEARAEIVAGKERLEELAGQPVTLFAYPNGVPGKDYSRRHIEILGDSGFAGAVTTASGVATAGQDIFQIPRFTPWDRTPGKFMLRLLQNYVRTRPLVV